MIFTRVAMILWLVCVSGGTTLAQSKGSSNPVIGVPSTGTRAPIVTSPPKTADPRSKAAAAGMNATVTKMRVTPTQVKPGESVSVDFYIRVQGAGRHTVPYSLSVDGAPVQRGSQSVSAGQLVRVSEKVRMRTGGAFDLAVHLSARGDGNAADDVARVGDVVVSDWPGWMCSLKRPTLNALERWRADAILNGDVLPPHLINARILGGSFEAALVSAMAVAVKDPQPSKVLRGIAPDVAKALDEDLLPRNTDLVFHNLFPTLARTPKPTATGDLSVPQPLHESMTMDGSSLVRSRYTRLLAQLPKELREWPEGKEAMAEYLQWVRRVLETFQETSTVTGLRAQGGRNSLPGGMPGMIVGARAQGKFLASGARFVDPGSWQCDASG